MPGSQEAEALLPVDTKDPFSRHRLALAAIGADLVGGDLRAALQCAARSDALLFADFLVKQGLGSYWHHLVTEQDGALEITPAFANALREARLAETALYLGQKAVLEELDRLFGSQDIIYAVIKGAHVRELVYADPALRPASDIDVLVDLDQREAAARALIGAGFRLHADPENISHEAAFTRGAVAIDLHWDILRPGRTRIKVPKLLLDRRQRVGDFWGVSNSDTAFLMLVHPAFAKYVCSPNMGLIRVADFMLWLHKRPVEWDAVAERLEETGLSTAAWTMLKWFAMLWRPERMPVPQEFVARVQPGAARRRYLAYWVQHNLPTRWFDKPELIQLGFTLLLHDRPSDAVHAILGWMRARRGRNADTLLQMHG